MISQILINALNKYYNTMQTYIPFFVLGIIGTSVFLFVCFYVNNKHYANLTSFGEDIRKIVCPWFFTLFMIMTTLTYLVVSKYISDKNYGPVVGAVCLVISWLASEIIYEMFEVGRDDNNKIMYKEDKIVCHFFAELAVVALFIELGKSNAEFIYFTCVTLSILIGAYIPIDVIFSGKNIIDIFTTNIKNFNNVVEACKLRTSIFSFSATVLFLGVVIFGTDLERTSDQLSVTGAGIFVGGLFFSIVVALRMKKEGKGRYSKKDN